MRLPIFQQRRVFDVSSGWQSIEMTITADLFEAYLKCPMKCWLRAKQTSEAATGNAYSEWVERQVAAHRSKGVESLFAAISETECAISVQKAALKTAKWRLAANVFVNAGKRESWLHALERIPSEGRGKLRAVRSDTVYSQR